MAKQLPELDELLGNYIADDDLLLVRDMSAKQDKRLSISELIKRVDNGEIVRAEDISSLSSSKKFVLRPMQNGKFEMIELPDIPVGSTLVVTRNQTQLVWSGTTKTIWSNGTWVQKGILKKTSYPHIIAISAPVNEKWVVKLHHITGSVHNYNSSSWSVSGIVEVGNSSGGGNKTFLTASLVANGDLYLHQETETFVEIPAGTTRYFTIWVVTNTTNNTTWYGGGDSTNTGTTWSFGNSCMFDASLIEREAVV